MVHTQRFVVRAVVAASIVAALAVGSGASAGAQTGYQLDNVTVNCTPSVTIHSNGWAPGEPVSADINPPLGTLVADAGGVIDGTLNLPSGLSTGPHVVTLNGFAFDGVTPRTQTFDVNIASCAAGAAAGALAFTGRNIGLVLAIAAAILIIGTAALLGARKRRHLTLSA